MKALEHIVIIGGGHAAWMAAASLGHGLKASDGRQLTAVSLIDTPRKQAPVVLSGSPTLRYFNMRAGVSEAQMFTAARALPFYGTRFEGLGPQPFWRAFGEYGARLNTVAFHHFLTWQAVIEGNVNIDDYTPAVKLAAAGRFTPPVKNADSALARVGHGVNLETEAYAAVLRASAPMVAVTKGEPAEVRRDEAGRVTAVQLKGGQVIEGDFFVDTEGWLVEQLSVPFEVAQGLSHDRSIQVSTPHGDELAANHLTVVEGGWTLRRPIAGEDRIRLVYDSRKLSDQAARAMVGAEAEAEVTSFVQGRRQTFWHGNVLMIGEAAGVLDGIGMHELGFVQQGISQFLALFPDQDDRPELAREYNRVMAQSFDNAADFTRLHYAEPAEGWGESVAQKVRYFRSRGHLQMQDNETASESDFISLLWGRGIRPERYDRIIDGLPEGEVLKRLEQMRNIINHEVNRLPSYATLRQQIEQAASQRP
ncbi:MAG: tryptophan 7-halogenase [Asticcacaulis sp.]